MTDVIDDDFVFETLFCDCCGIEFPVLVFNHPETGVHDEYNLCDDCIQNLDN